MIPWLAGLSVTWKLILLGCILASLSGGYFYIWNSGHDAGWRDGQRQQIELDKQSFQQDRKQFLDTLSAAQKVNDEAQQVIAQKDSQLAQLQSRRDANRKVVQSLPDASLIPSIHSQLGRPDSDNLAAVPSLSTTDLREIALRLSDLQNVEEQVRLLGDKSAQQDIRIAAIEKQRDAAILAYNQLVPLYAKAYNAAQPKRNWFMRLFHIKGKHLNLPDPVTLKGN